jgi:hypothetical protein
VEATNLSELLAYENGNLFWKHRENAMPRWNTRYAGKQAFTADRQGYKTGSIHNRVYQAHRVIWAMHHGRWPQGQIDHINGDRSDNRIENLREVDAFLNSQNAKRRADNTSGTAGVTFFKGRNQWTARICVNGRKHHLGYFPSAEDAAAARKEAEIKLGFLARHHP